MTLETEINPEGEITFYAVSSKGIRRRKIGTIKDISDAEMLFGWKTRIERLSRENADLYLQIEDLRERVREVNISQNVGVAYGDTTGTVLNLK